MIDWDSCVLWLDSKYFSESYWWDRSRYRNDGVVHGAKWKANAFYFDGVNDYVDCGNNESLDLSVTDAFSIGAWVNAYSFPDLQTRIVCGKENQVILDQMNGFWRIYFYGDNDTHNLTGSYAQTNVWVHLVGTYDAEEGILKLYLNGEQDATEDCNNDTIDAAKFSNVHIGAKTVGFRPWHGMIAEVWIYNRALSEEEIKAIYNLTYRRI